VSTTTAPTLSGHRMDHIRFYVGNAKQARTTTHAFGMTCVALSRPGERQPMAPSTSWCPAKRASGSPVRCTWHRRRQVGRRARRRRDGPGQSRSRLDKAVEHAAARARPCGGAVRPQGRARTVRLPRSPPTPDPAHLVDAPARRPLPAGLRRPRTAVPRQAAGHPSALQASTTASATSSGWTSGSLLQPGDGLIK